MTMQARMMVVVGTLVACSSGPVTHYEPKTPAPAASAGAPDAAPLPTARPAVPITIDMTSQPAAWFQPHLGTGIDDPLEDPALVAVGDKVAVLKVRAGYFAVGPKGADGPLAVPADTKWVGVGGKGDWLLAATGSGDLYRASYPTGAKADAFALHAKVPRATGWDAVPGWIVASSGGAVMVSKDGDKRFRPRRVTRRGAVVTALVRPDGAIVAQVARTQGATAQRTTYQAKATGRFRKAPFQPGKVVRTGARIHDDDGDCTAVFADDARRWVMPGENDEPPELHDWGELLGHAHDFGMVTPKARQTARQPAPAKAKKGNVVTGRDKNCGSMRSRGYPVGKGAIGTLVGYSASVLGRIARTRGPAVYPSRYDAQLLTDVECAKADVDSDGDCKPGALMHGTARAVVIDRKVGTARLVAAPKACTPIRATTIHGMSLLRCQVPGKADRLSVHALSGDRFVEEVPDIRDPEDDDAVAADGTLALYTDCAGKDHCVWLRRPVAPGAKDAWREVNVPGGVAYRVLPGGRVLALARVGEAPKKRGVPEKVRFVLDSPGGKRTVLAEGVDIETVVRAFVVTAAGHIRLVLEDGETGKGERLRYVHVAKDGRLITQPPPVKDAAR